ncbi:MULTISPECIES: hypothetical protein [Pseudomonas]|uniref:Lipoprotein n=1 Tax=Pseudomonas donghuensis TaxID=1163398 RepID=A0AAP0SIX9_9PSED|nr:MULTISPECIES: hypothetical protein [Pseudomonas]MDF9893335.1 hypothetical protein [Pseudomonas vranovensis]KDN99023.1 hypothetical protein BV82_3183 [Pseudomonas donghuensis]MBF4207403.1 hypothetical protein [Pseudomonas donghuensis]MCP6691232.1 hypothetical protein [Pseudomonas donghuensis]PJY95994.1 hypothetical protein COO64_14365 [Pseudomonas donghuensis]
MLRIIKANLLLGAVLLTGCVSYSQHELAPVQSWPPQAQAQAVKPTAYVRTTAQYQVNRGQPNATAGKPAEAWEQALVDTYKQSGRFARVSTEKVTADIYAESTLTNHEQYNVASAIITGATFFIIPSTARNTFTLDTVFKDKDGKELGRISKSESVRTWMHLVLIVGIPFQQDTSELVRQLTQSTLDEAVKRQLL